MKKDDGLTLYERTGMYEILSEEETETHRIVKMRTYSGVINIMKFPKHTPEEQARVDWNLMKALAKFCYPDLDLSNVKTIELIKD